MLEYLAFMHGETVSHAGLVRLLKVQYGWNDLSAIEDCITSLPLTYAMVVQEDLYCCCAYVPCYKIREDCESIRKIVAELAESPNALALRELPHVKACQG
jgi:hypothetical protein